MNKIYLTHAYHNVLFEIHVDLRWPKGYYHYHYRHQEMEVKLSVG